MRRRPPPGWAVKPLCDDLAKISLMLRETVPRKAVEALESEVRKLADRVEYTRYAGGDGTGLASDVREAAKTREALRAVMPAESLLGMVRAVQRLSQKVATLIEKLDASDARLNHLEAIERGLAELLVHSHASACRISLASQRRRTWMRSRRTSPSSGRPKRRPRSRSKSSAACSGTSSIGWRDRDRHAWQGRGAARRHARAEGGLACASRSDGIEAAYRAREARDTFNCRPGFHRPHDARARSVFRDRTPPDRPEPATRSSGGNGCWESPWCRPALPADRVPACESEGVGAVGRPSVNPDRGGKSDFIAAARRAAQAAGGGPRRRVGTPNRRRRRRPRIGAASIGGQRHSDRRWAASDRGDPGQPLRSNGTDHADRHRCQPRHRARCRWRTGRHCELTFPESPPLSRRPAIGRFSFADGANR